MAVIFKDMLVNNIFLNLQNDKCFLVLKHGTLYHTILYEQSVNTEKLYPERMDIIAKLSKPAEAKARKIIQKILNRKAELSDNVFGNLVINVEPILDMKLKDILTFYPPNHNDDLDGRKQLYEDNYVPYTGFVAPLWRIFRHYKLHGKTREQWNMLKKRKTWGVDQKPDANYPLKRAKERYYWGREDWVNYINEMEYPIDTKRKSLKVLQKIVQEFEDKQEKNRHIEHDILPKLSKNKKKLDKKTKRKRKIIFKKFNK